MNAPPEFSAEELALLRPLTTPAKIQDFLNTLAINHEKRRETCYSPRQVLQKRKAHCLEGALLAATALSLTGEPMLLMELRTMPGDQDHAVALFKQDGYWGAISKTNHTALRYRDPVYKTLRELALSYFNEYFLNDTGRKTLRGYTRAFSLKPFGTDWITSEDEVWHIAYALRKMPEFPLVPNGRRHLRPADALERRGGELVEWRESDPRT